MSPGNYMSHATMPVGLWVYSQPSVSMGSVSKDLTNHGSKIYICFKSYIVPDVYYAVRPTVVVAVLNRYWPFPFHHSLNDITAIYMAFTLY